MSMQYLALQNRRIGLSGAIPDINDQGPGGRPVNEYEMQLAVERIIEAIFDAGGTLVYGSHPTFTPLVEPRGNAIYAQTGEKRVIMFAAKAFYGERRWNDFYHRHDRYAKVIGTGEFQSGSRSVVLTAMRTQMAEMWEALVCVGGKAHRGEDRHRPGVEEESELSHGKPLYLVGCFGGYAQELWQKAPGLTANNGIAPYDDERLNRHGLPPWKAAQLVIDGLIKELGRESDNGASTKRR